MINNIQEKLAIVKILFSYCFNDKLNHKKVDYESIDWVGRAWNIATDYLRNNDKRILTENNLRYINKVIKNLVSILGTDEAKINYKYIQDNKLDISLTPEIKLWIETYKKLLILIKENNYEL